MKLPSQVISLPPSVQDLHFGIPPIILLQSAQVLSFSCWAYYTLPPLQAHWEALMHCRWLCSCWESVCHLEDLQDTQSIPHVILDRGSCMLYSQSGEKAPVTGLMPGFR